MWTWALLRIAVVNTWSVRMSAKYTLQQAVQGGAAVSHGVDLEESGFGVGPPGRRYRAQIPGVSVSSVSIASSQSVIAAARYCLSATIIRNGPSLLQHRLCVGGALMAPCLPLIDHRRGGHRPAWSLFQLGEQIAAGYGPGSSP